VVSQIVQRPNGIEAAELIAMNSRMPDQDNIQERLKTVLEECRRLREENADLRVMLGINQSPPMNPFHKPSRSLPQDGNSVFANVAN
jgi:hypothetical protein